MLMIYGNEALWSSFSEEQTSDLIGRTDAQLAALRSSGELVGAYGLADEVLAKTVRVRDGVPAITDGPYLEAKEHLASFTIVDCESLERALEIAAANPAAEGLQVEVWPIEHEAPPEA
jgi:hypothetical protein